MPLLRVRTEIDDRPGRLAVLTAVLAAQGANILDLSVQVDADGVVDEFVVDVPTGTTAEALTTAVAVAAGCPTSVVPATPHELIDEPSRALSLAVRLRSNPRALPDILADGTEITVRPLTLLDVDAVRDMHARCSSESRRRRYFGARGDIPVRLLRVFCDRAHGLTMTAEGPDRSLLALAHLMYTLDPGVGELAFLVEDGWQGRGIGAALARRLLAVAHEQGLAEVRATMLADNSRVRALLGGLGARFVRSEDPRLLDARIALGPDRTEALQPPWTAAAR
jgi:GNAT superfamily N-acetyltransferase